MQRRSCHFLAARPIGTPGPTCAGIAVKRRNTAILGGDDGNGKIQDRAHCGAARANRGSVPCNTHASMEGQSIMTDNPVELDEHRGMAAQKSTEIRRRLHQVQADQAALRRRQEEFERHAVAAPSTTWPEAAAKARYLIL